VSDETTVRGEEEIAAAPEPLEPRGMWQCLAPKGCQDAAEGRPFEGPSQPVAQARAVSDPLTCPACGGTKVIYIRDITPARAGA